MSAELNPIPLYQPQDYKDAPMKDQCTGKVVEFRHRKEGEDALRIELGDRVISKLVAVQASEEDEDVHTNDEAMRGVTLDRQTTAAKQHEHAIEMARQATDSAFERGDIYSD